MHSRLMRRFTFNYTDSFYVPTDSQMLLPQLMILQVSPIWSNVWMIGCCLELSTIVCHHAEMWLFIPKSVVREYEKYI
jgi:hypothetical protein